MESHVDDDEVTTSQDVSSQVVETEKEESIKTLTEKLSAALANVSSKDELVNQHAKVAEEAVAGWEKAESEAIELKEKLDSLDDKNRVLEDRVSHLDGALKECVKQLRQAREEQEERVQIQESASKTKELSEMAESVAKENVVLRNELIARCEELEIRTIERDLSTQAAENASKQQLDIIKKVAKLEAECRKLRVLANKSSSQASFSDSHSDGGGERMDMSLHGASSSSVEIDLMGDFLEMERLVALPETPDKNGKSVVQTENSLVSEVEVLTCLNKELEEKLEKLVVEKDKLENEVKSNKEVESTLRFELEAMGYDKMELEEKLEKLVVKKDELESEVKCNKEVENLLRLCLETITSDKVELEEKLEKLVVEKDGLESEVLSNREVESTLRFELEAMVCDKMELEEKLKKLVAEKDELETKVKCNKEVESKLRFELEAITSDKVELEEKLEKLVAEKDELEGKVKCNKEVESTYRFELEAITSDKVGLEEKLEKLIMEKDELESKVTRRREVENTLRYELEAMVCDKKELENKLEKIEVEKAELQISFDIIKDKYKESQVCLQGIETKLQETQKEMTLAYKLKSELESQIISMEAESKTKSIKIESLEQDMSKEKLACDELRRKCETLEEEVSINRDYTEPKIKQEDMVKAAGKLENCRKTIASLEKQLQSLATLEDFLVETTSIPLDSNGRNHQETIRATTETSSLSLVSRGSSEKNRNGFAKVFTRSKDGIHLAI